MIGNDSKLFNGTLDGLGNTISNVTINNGNELVGFISALNPTGAVRNLSVGENLTATSTIIAAVGGLVATNDSGTISNAHTSGSVTVANNSVQSNYPIGGLVGNNLGSIMLSSSSAQVSGTGSNTAFAVVGGLVGVNQGSIVQSFATGGATNNSDGGGGAGGLVGENGTTGTITNSYATGNVSGTVSGISVGGLVGLNINSPGPISKSFSTGTVSGVSGDNVGGFIGENQAGRSFASDYWDTTTSGTGSGIGLDMGPATAPPNGKTTSTLASALPVLGSRRRSGAMSTTRRRPT